MQKRLVLKVHGMVQGVGYRYSAQIYASQLGLTGYVKNEPDGTVKIVAEGEEKNLKELINWCYNGVSVAQVYKVDIEWEKATGKFERFEIEF